MCNKKLEVPRFDDIDQTHEFAMVRFVEGSITLSLNGKGIYSMSCISLYTAIEINDHCRMLQMLKRNKSSNSSI